MPITIRDIQHSVSDRFNKKADKELFVRAVITDAQGNQTGAGTIWAEFNTKRVWYMTHGAAQPAQIRCVRVPNPYIGLKVLIGYYPGSNELEVISDDPFDRVTNNGTGVWATLTSDDLAPGGRALLWLQTKALVPLATWPSTGITVNVNPGWLWIGGVEVFYAGVSGYDVSASQPAGPNEVRYVGLYLDSTGALGTVDGTIVAVGTVPPEPTWPVGVLRLCLVQLNDTQTSISFATDVIDRRPIWVSGEGAGGAWPKPGKVNIGDVEYATIAAAIAAAAAGDLIKIGEGVWAEDLTITQDLTLIGADYNTTTITQAAAANTLTINNSALVMLQNLTINNTYDSGASNGIDVSGGATLITLHCIISTINDNAGAAIGILIQDAIAEFYDTDVSSDNVGAGVGYGIYLSNGAADVTVRDGVFSGKTNDAKTIAGSALTFLGTQLLNDNSAFVAGTIFGQWLNNFGATVYAGAITPADLDVPIWDLVTQKWIPGPMAGGGGWPYSHVLTVDQTDPDADYATIAAAVAASAPGDTILIGAGSYYEQIDITTAITLAGLGIEETIITYDGDYTLSITGGGTVQDLTIINNKSAGTSANTVIIGGNSSFYRVKTNFVGPGGLDYAEVFYITGGTVLLDDCYAELSGVGTTGMALYVVGGTVKVVGGVYDGNLAYYFSFNNAGGTVYLYKPTFAGPVSLGGTNHGEYQDVYGVTRYVGNNAPTAAFIPMWDAVNSRWLPLAFDWDTVKAATGADMVHDHSSAAEGGTIAAAALAHNVLSATHSDALAAAVVDGDTIIGNVTPKWSRLAISIPAANVLNYLGVNNGELRPSWKSASDTPLATAKILQSNSTGGLTLAGALEAKNLKATDFTASTLPVINASKVLITLANAAGYLKNDGAGAFSYDAVPAAGHNILSATHTDAVGAAACVAGDLLYGNATPKWDRLAKGTAYQVLAMNAAATAPAWGGIAIAGAQPIVSALKTDAANTNVTGDGTFYAYICNTEIFDVGANYNAGTGVFTAPVTAKYLLVTGVYPSDIGASHTIFYHRFITSNRTYVLSYENSTRVADAGNLIRSGSVIADMDAGDTAYPDFAIYGSTKTCDVNGHASTFFTYFQIYMLI